jgi:hypothetical protein
MLSPEPEQPRVAEETSNDNDVSAGHEQYRGPDAHGQAAMLLVESLIHSLIARSVISVAEALEIVKVAAEVKEEVAADLGDSPATMRKSLSLLNAIEASLAPDLPPR